METTDAPDGDECGDHENDSAHPQMPTIRSSPERKSSAAPGTGSQSFRVASQDMRKLIVGALSVLAAALPAGCGAAENRSERGAEAVSSGSGDLPAGLLFLRHVREPSITRIDLASGASTTVSLPQLAPGDPPFQLVETGGRLVAYGGSHTYALDLDLQRPPQDLGESWYFVPSGREGRVWLTTLDPESPETVRDLKAVREVTIDGDVTVPETGRPPSRGPTIVAAVEDGLLFQEDDGLRLWDPLAGRVTLRLAGPFPADTHGNLVAWCRQGCAKLHVTDVATGEDFAIPPADSFRFEETYDGAFSPDGTLLAVPVVTSPGTHLEGHRHQVGIIDARAGTARLIEGSKLADDYPAMTWSPSGEWLFYSAGGGRIMASRPASEKAIVLPTRAPASFIDMAAG